MNGSFRGESVWQEPGIYGASAAAVLACVTAAASGLPALGSRNDEGATGERDSIGSDVEDIFGTPEPAS